MMFIGLNSQVFPQKEIKCIHRPEENFTDAVFVEDFQPFQSGLFELLNKKWEEISQSNHFRTLSEEDRRVIGKYAGLTKKKLAHLVNEIIYQIAIGEKEEFRLFVIKRKSHNKDLLEIVLFDPNHLFFPSQKKSKYPYGEGVVCLSNIFNKDSSKGKINCSRIEEEPQEQSTNKKKRQKEIISVSFVNPKKRKINSFLIIISYDGSGFAGWAIQPNKFTVQGYIETVLSRIFQKKINILATSRTDKGVHAREQKFTLRLNLLFSQEKLFDLLKKALGKHVLVKKVQRVDNKFHPLRNIFNKEYRYFINIGKFNIWQKKYHWEYNLPLEVKKLNSILQVFQGQHNFFNYSYCRWQEREKTNTEREITSLKCWKRQNIIIISIIAKSFLRYQIRAIIGEVISCYEGKQTINDLKAKLTNFDKKNYKYKNIAPAAGLYLWKIDYEK